MMYINDKIKILQRNGKYNNINDRLKYYEIQK